MPPKKRSTRKQAATKARPSAASRPSTPQRFDEIEKLLLSMQGGGASSTTKKKGTASSSGASATISKPKRQKKKKPPVEEDEDVIGEEEEEEEEAEDLPSQFTAGESSLSDDLDANAFLEQFKTLAAQKKKVEATRIARANKRTITDMERLGTELKVITSQEVGVLTKGLLEESRKEEKELGKLASEANRYASESKRVRIGVETGLKEMLGEATKFSRRMEAVGKDFAQRCKAIDAKMKADLDKEQKRIERLMAKRAKTDQRLQNVVEFLRGQSQQE